MSAPSPRRVLVVEDDQDFRANVVEWLEAAGYDVSEAAHGRAAMELAEDQPFDVVVTDLKMPEADGLELLEWFKVMHPSTAVIFLSGQATVRDAIQALREWGGFDFLEKPIELTALSAVVERAIARRPDTAAAETTAPDPLSPFAQRALQLIAERFREPLGLGELSHELGYSAAYLTNTLRRETGKTVLQWIIHYRLEEAKRLMRETDWSGQQIALAVGYSHYSHFLRQFRQVHGIPPTAWRSANCPR